MLVGMFLSTEEPKSRRTVRKGKAAAKPRPTVADSEPEIVLPPAHDWRTTDEDEINRRRLRARGTFRDSQLRRAVSGVLQFFPSAPAAA